MGRSGVDGQLFLLCALRQNKLMMGFQLVSKNKMVSKEGLNGIMNKPMKPHHDSLEKKKVSSVTRELSARLDDQKRYWMKISIH